MRRKIEEAEEVGMMVNEDIEAWQGFCLESYSKKRLSEQDWEQTGANMRMKARQTVHQAEPQWWMELGRSGEMWK